MKQILIVDDDINILNLVETILVEEGFRVYKAEGPEEALRVFDTGIDLLITDFEMPGMNGFELIKRIKGIKPQLKTVMLSGSHPLLFANTDVNLLKSLGIAALIQKPFKINHLMQTIGETLQ